MTGIIDAHLALVVPQTVESKSGEELKKQWIDESNVNFE